MQACPAQTPGGFRAPKTDARGGGCDVSGDKLEFKTLSLAPDGVLTSSKLLNPDWSLACGDMLTNSKLLSLSLSVMVTGGVVSIRRYAHQF